MVGGRVVSPAEPILREEVPVKKTIVVFAILLLCVAIFCVFFFVRDYMTAQDEMSEYDAVQNEYTSILLPVVENVRDQDMVPKLTEVTGLPYVSADFDALLADNPETVGWIAIPDSVISYPVVQTKDNVKYLSTSFLGKRSSAGTPFADKNNNLQDLDANTIIYGHNMGTGRQDMFGSLLSYKDKSYFETHRYIQFDTIYQQHGWWKVFAVIEYDIRSEEFQYLRTQFESDDGFLDWIDAATAQSIFDSGLQLSANDRVLTLSTCDRSKYGKNGRLLVLAVRMQAPAP